MVESVKRIKNIDITKKVFWFRAKKIPDFKIGTPKFLKFHDEYFDPNYDKKSHFFDLTGYSNKKKPQIKVRLMK